ncbi:MAG: hypothetical protein ACXWBM_11745 [Chthoniobacterales bacterium]
MKVGSLNEPTGDPEEPAVGKPAGSSASNKVLDCSLPPRVIMASNRYSLHAFHDCRLSACFPSHGGARERLDETGDLRIEVRRWSERTALQRLIHGSLPRS